MEDWKKEFIEVASLTPVFDDEITEFEYERKLIVFIETLLQEEREKVVLEIAVNLTEVFEKYSDEMTDEEVRGFSLMNGFAHGILDRYLSKKGEKE